MSLPKIVSQEEWVAAPTRAARRRRRRPPGSATGSNTERRELPMVEVTKAYEFEGPDGTRVAASTCSRAASS